MSSIERGPGAEIPLLGQRGPAGIGGWLLVVAFVQLLATVVLPVRLAREFVDPEYREVFREFPLAGYGELALSIASILLVWATTILLFRKSPFFPRFFILQFIASATVPWLQTAWIAFAFSSKLGRPFSDVFELEAQETQQFVVALIAAAIWITYTLRSKRVRNTFILGLSARDMQGEETGTAAALEAPLLLVIGAVIFTLGMGSIAFGVLLTLNRGVFNFSILGGALQVALALWLLRGSDVARIVLAFLFGLGTVLWVWIAFFAGQAAIGMVILLVLALLCAGVFWVLVFSKRFRAELAINAAKYRKPDAEEAVG